MSSVAPAVEALIQAAGWGRRLRQGPKAFLRLGAETLLERAVATMSEVADKIIVAVNEDDLGRARELINGPNVSILAGGSSRSETFSRLVSHSSAPWLLLHDVVHPFVTAALAERVLAAARVAGCAAAAIANTEFIHHANGALAARPGEVMIVLKPVAFQRSAILLGQTSARPADASGDLGVLELLALAGVTPTFVKAPSHNFKITTMDDLRLARALAAQEGITGVADEEPCGPDRAGREARQQRLPGQ